MDLNNVMMVFVAKDVELHPQGLEKALDVA